MLFESRHYKRMGAAVWLYGWLILRQTRQEGAIGWVLGGAPITYRDIEEETGFNCRTIERWMQILRRKGYVETETVPAGLVIRITKAKKFPQRGREFADGARRVADPSPRNCGPRPRYPAYSQYPPDKIGSSSLGGLEIKENHENFHRDFHSPTLTTESKSQNTNTSFSGEPQKASDRAHRSGENKPRHALTTSDEAFLRHLFFSEREEAIRRELAVGTGPEVRRT